MHLRRFIAVFMIWLVFTLPISAASVMASMSINSVVVSGEDGANGFAKPVDKIKVSANLTSDVGLTTSNVRICNAATSKVFDSCEAKGNNEYVCDISFEEETMITSGYKLNEYLCLYESEKGAYNTGTADNNPLDLSQHEVNPDYSRPLITSVELNSAKNTEGNSGVNIKFTADDTESGISRYEIWKGSSGGVKVKDVELLCPQSQCQTSVDISEFLELSGGTYDIVIKVFNGINMVSETTKSVNIDTQAPQFINWYVLDSEACENDMIDLNTYRDYEVSAVGKDQRDVCVVAFFDYGDDIVDESLVSATFIDFDSKFRQGEYLNSAPDECFLGESSYCIFRYYDLDENNEPELTDPVAINMESEHGTASAMSAIFYVSDSSGNENVFTKSKSVTYISQAPTIDSLTTSKVTSEGVYYMAQNGNISLQFSGAIEKLDPSLVKLDVCKLISNDNADTLQQGQSCTGMSATDCDVDTCYWEIYGVDRNDGELVDVSLVNSYDPFYNKLNKGDEVETLQVQVDLTNPELVTLQAKNPDVNTGRLFKQCPLPDDEYYDDSQVNTCLACSDDYYNPNSNCSYKTFWTYNASYFLVGQKMELETVFSDNVKPQNAYIELPEDLVSHIDGKYYNEVDCTASGDNIKCNWYDIGPFDNTLNKFNLTIIDFAGNEKEYVIHVPVYSSVDDSDNVWSSELNSISMSPEKIDRQLLNTIYTNYTRQDVVIDLKSNNYDGAEILHVEVDECRSAVSSDEDEETDVSGLISDSFAMWDGSTVFLNLLYGFDPMVDAVDISCDLLITTKVGGDQVIGPEKYDDISFTAEFFNYPFGTPSQEIEAEVEDVKSNWGAFYNDILAPINKFMGWSRSICSVGYSLSAVITSVSVIIDMFKTSPTQVCVPGTQITSTANDVITLAQSGILSYFKIYCDYITCRHCQKDFDKNMGFEKLEDKSFWGCYANWWEAVSSDDQELEDEGQICKQIFGLGLCTSMVLTTIQNPVGLLVSQLDWTDSLMDMDGRGNIYASGTNSQEDMNELNSDDEDISGDSGDADVSNVFNPLLPSDTYTTTFSWDKQSDGSYYTELYAERKEDFSWRLYGGGLLNDIAPELINPPGPMAGDDSFTASLLSLCIPGILKNVEKFRQIDCKYIKCLTEDVVEGKTTVETCKFARNYAKCKYGVEEWWNFMPLSQVFDMVARIIENFMTNPLMVLEYAGSAACWYTCKHCVVPGCKVCTAITHLGNIFDAATMFFSYVSDESARENFFEEDFCEGVM